MKNDFEQFVEFVEKMTGQKLPLYMREHFKFMYSQKVDEQELSRLLGEAGLKDVYMPPGLTQELTTILNEEIELGSEFMHSLDDALDDALENKVDFQGQLDHVKEMKKNGERHKARRSRKKQLEEGTYKKQHDFPDAPSGLQDFCESLLRREVEWECPNCRNNQTMTEAVIRENIRVKCTRCKFWFKEVKAKWVRAF